MSYMRPNRFMITGESLPVRDQVPRASTGRREGKLFYFPTKNVERFLPTINDCVGGNGVDVVIDGDHDDGGDDDDDEYHQRVRG